MVPMVRCKSCMQVATLRWNPLHGHAQRRRTARLAGKGSGPPADGDGQQRPRRPPRDAPPDPQHKQQQQQPRPPRAPQRNAPLTVDQWLDMARHASVSPKVLCDVLRALAGVEILGGVQDTEDAPGANGMQEESDVQQPDSSPDAPDVQQVRDAVLALVRKRGTRGRQLATFADALGTGLDAQPAVLKGLTSNAQHIECVMGVLEACATGDDTFSNVRCTSQVATAQRKLRLYCDAFWQQLERRGLSSLPARELATVVYCRARLVEDVGAPAPTDLLWDMMQRAIEHEARHMGAQGLANVFLACGYVGKAPAAGARKAVFGALRSKQVIFKPQEAANVVWAAGHLRMQLDSAEEQLLLQQLLLQQLQKHSRCLSAQQVSNTWVGLAHLGLQPDAHLAAELQDAVAHMAGAMNEQNVANTLWAFAKLKLHARDHVVDALLQRCWAVSSGMGAQGVSSTLYAMAKMQLDVGSKLRAALLHQAEKIAPEMLPQHVANSLWALAEAGITLDPELSGALLSQVEHLHSKFEALGVVQVLVGVARLGLQPSDSQRRAIAAAHKRTSGAMDAQEKGKVRHALQQLGWDT